MYESFYLRAVAPDRPLGVWIRYTAHKPPGQPARGSLWCTVSTAPSDAPFMHKLTTDELSVPAGGWIAVGDARLGPGSAEGACGEARWSLRFASAEPELRHLPHALLYRAPLPRTKLTSPAPAARFEGTLELAGRTHRARRLARDGRPQLGRPARRALDLAARHRLRGAARGVDRRGDRTGARGGAHHPVGRQRGAAHRRRAPPAGRRGRAGAAGRRAPRALRAHAAGRRRARGEAHVQAPPAALAGWRYADPDGAARGHQTT